MDTVNQAPILIAASLLVLALIPVQRLLVGLPEGSLRRGWTLMAGQLTLLVLVAALYSLEVLGAHTLSAELLVPAMLVGGSWFVLTVCVLSASSIDGVRRLAVLEQETITDGLTGLSNRRHLDRELEAEIKRARRHDQPLSVILIDLDHFKAVNDTHGHQVGDAVLIQVSRRLQQLSRANDVVARFGGEELAIVVPATDLAQARRQAERLRASIAQSLFAGHCEGLGAGLRLSVSIGVSSLSARDEQGADLLRRADAALYRAKAGGRNRVELESDNTAPLHPRVTSLAERRAQRDHAA